MRLLDAIALFVIDRKGIPVEIVGELLKQRVSEVFILQDPQKSQLRKSRLQSGCRRRLREKRCPFFSSRGDLVEIRGEKNFAVFEIANENGAADQRVKM